MANAVAKRGTRSVYLDALRAFALMRVILYHATSKWMVTAFTAMPLMFFIAGSLYAASLERRPARHVIRDRYRRIMFPYWVYLVLMVALWASLGVLGQLNPLNWISFIMPVLSIDGPQGPGAGTTLELTWIALWYIQLHLIFSLIGPWLRRAQQNRQRALWITMGVVFLLTAPVVPGLSIAIFYMACWIVGYYQHDGWLEPRLARTYKPICAVTGILGILLFAGFHSRQEAISALGAALLGIFWLCLAMGLRPRIEPLLTGRRTRTFVNWMSQRSLTIYLWHMVTLYTAIELSLPGVETIAGRLFWCVALIPVAVVSLGWAEDLAARRPPTLWPRLPRTAEGQNTAADPGITRGLRRCSWTGTEAT